MTVMAKVRLADGKRQMVGETGSGHAIVLDVGADSGGRDTGMRPLELMLMGQAGCTAMDVLFIMEKMRRPLTGLEVAVEGERRDTHPKMFETIQVVYRVRGVSVREKDIVKAIRLSETTYCSASAIMAQSATIVSRYEIVEETTGEVVTSGQVEAYEE